MMVAPSARARMHAAETMADPLFRKGHDAGWRGVDLTFQNCWIQSERKAYQLGFEFAIWLKEQGSDRQQFTKGGCLNAELAADFVRFSSRDLIGAIA